MPVIGMTVNKRQKEELKAIVRETCLTQFAHPQDPNILSTFLPPGAGVGTLVQVAVEQYDLSNANLPNANLSTANLSRADLLTSQVLNFQVLTSQVLNFQLLTSLLLTSLMLTSLLLTSLMPSSGVLTCLTEGYSIPYY
jgi:uncharacterized protein YjbI with pentapeptide repeats